MIEPPQIIQTVAQRTALIHVTIPREQVRQVMGPGLAELHAALAAQGVTPIGPWFTHHLRMVPDVFDFEISLPVDVEITPGGRVVAGTLPARRAATTVYHGSYEGLPGGWGEFAAWIRSQGLAPAPDLWEVYAAGPESSANPADWRTELFHPLAG